MFHLWNKKSPQVPKKPAGNQGWVINVFSSTNRENYIFGCTSVTPLSRGRFGSTCISGCTSFILAAERWASA